MKARDLRNSILQMAVEGKLVPQDPNDEPASVLLERIREEKQRLIAEGKAKFPKGGESVIYTGSDGSPYEKRIDAKGHVLSEKCIVDGAPFEGLPEGWTWARLGSLCDFGKCQNIEYKHVAEGAWNLDLEDIEKDSGIILRKKRKVKGETGSTKHVFAPGMVLYSKLRPYLNKVVVADEGGVCSSEILPLYFPELNSGYAQLILMEPGFVKYAKECSYGVKMPRLGANDGKRWLVALPPLAEQHYIVERVNELIPLVEEYGKLEEAREELDAALPERLRKSILQMAVQGKLVPQDSADEPASVLLKRIREQRRKMIAEKKMKAPKGGESVIFRGSDGRRYEKRIDAKGRESEPACVEDEIPFDIPDSWEWVRLSTVLQLSSGLGYKKDNLSVKGEHMVRVLRGGNIGEDDEPLIKDNDVLISAEFVDDSLLLRDGQIITPAVTSLENVGKAAIVRNTDGETVCGGFVFYLTPYLKSICHSEYLHRYLASPGHIAFCKSVVKKSGQAFYNLSKASLNSALIAIPPLAEQHRIVDRVNELMPLITNQ